MAGNTKMIGFGAGNEVVFERWNGKATVGLSEESIKALRELCYKTLPKKPAQTEVPSRIAYYPDVGKVSFLLDPADAEYLRSLINDNVEAFKLLPRADDELETRAKMIEFWVKGIDAALAAHDAYTSVEGEPGVDPAADGITGS